MDIQYTDDMIQLRDEIYADIFDFCQGGYVGWLFKVKDTFRTLYKDNMETEQDFLMYVLTDEMIEKWLAYPSVQLYFRSPEYTYEGARSQIRRFIRSRAIDYVTTRNTKYEKTDNAKYLVFNLDVSPDNTSYDIKHPEMFVAICKQAGISKAEKMADCLIDVYGKGMTYKDACKKHHISHQTYYDNLNKIKEIKTEVKTMARKNGYYITSDLERETYWSPEMMEQKYGTKPFPINDGYFEQFDGVANTKIVGVEVRVKKPL